MQEMMSSEQGAIDALWGEFENGLDSQSDDISGDGDSQNEGANEAYGDGDSKNEGADSQVNKADKSAHSEPSSEQNAAIAALTNKVNELITKMGDREAKKEIIAQDIDNELASIGLNSTNEQIKILVQKMGDMEALMEKNSQIAKMQEVFLKNSAQLAKDFEGLNANELGEWAEKNGFMEMLNSEKYENWAAVAKIFLKLNKAQKSSDNITKNSGAGETSTYDKLKKGEQVSDIEIGAMLLAEIGG